MQSEHRWPLSLRIPISAIGNEQPGRNPIAGLAREADLLASVAPFLVSLRDPNIHRNRGRRGGLAR